MPPKTPGSSILSTWRCPQCSTRGFSTTGARRAIGPEHPRFIEIPEPPQQNIVHRAPVKGFLPVPRNIFGGAARHKANPKSLDLTTPEPTTPRNFAPGSREEWKAKMAALRRENLREGVQILHARQTIKRRQSRVRSSNNRREREERLARPEREDERLTTPSLGLDLARLSHAEISDPTRETRLQRRVKNLQAFEAKKRAKQLDSLHTLYMNAQEFIVTPKQLDAALDKVFGTPEKPVSFGSNSLSMNSSYNSPSIWSQGRPLRVQDMLNRANPQGKTPNLAMSGTSSSYDDINKRRIKQIAEMFTGGKMDSSSSE